MLLLTSFLVDILLPEDDNSISFYDKFLAQYTSITVSAIVSQSHFYSETYNTKLEDLDRDVDNIINEIPDASKRKREMYKVLCFGAMMNPGDIVQEKEKRTFVSDLFIQDAKKYNISNREMIIKSLNTSTFLNYFFLLEDSLKYISSNGYLKGSEVISKALKSILETEKILDEFNAEIYERSKFFINFDSLEKTWSLLNFIRNRIIHYNGYYDKHAKDIFEKKFNDILNLYLDIDTMNTSIFLLINNFEKYTNQINEFDYLIWSGNIISDIEIK
ncbi:MAG: hypothetical protein AB7S49_13605 [Arcobacter sp.]|uniref:hypothetical protein n=1 Tax=Arcobacter sp. TaxID=1872629 RepID=UPI003CFBECC9